MDTLFFLKPDNVSIADPAKGMVLLVNKPIGYTSFDIIAVIRKGITDTSKIKLKVGHAGTLDPLASGLLIVCTGKYTSIIDSFQAQEKVYSGIFKIGATTPSYDMETTVDNTYNIEHISSNQLIETAKSFLGDQWMTPPVFSAIKVNGKKAYDLARAGKEVELIAKQICIEEFNVYPETMPDLRFYIRCSKGTYIRSVANEFGKKLNSGAYLAALQRNAIGNYKLEDAWELDDLKQHFPVLKARFHPGSVT